MLSNPKIKSKYRIKTIAIKNVKQQIPNSLSCIMCIMCNNKTNIVNITITKKKLKIKNNTITDTC